MSRRIVCLFSNKLIAFLVLACFAFPASGQVQSTFTDIRHDVSRPLRDLVKTAPAPFQTPTQKVPATAPVLTLPEGFKPADVPDSVIQTTTAGNPAAAATPVAGLNFEGLGQGFTGFEVVGAPADPSGSVGLTQYVQWVNFSFAVFDKATGNVVVGPAPGNSLWQGFGGSCETNNDGEPSVVYDKLADRWIFSQFAVINSTDTGFGPFFQCIAVSTTADATGTYNRYAFQYSSFNDDTKIGVWPDAYYVTSNFIDTVSLNSLGGEACAYDRSAMLAGLPATQICFAQDTSVGILRPADMDGHNPPPAGSPNYMATFGVNALNLYKFHVDFATPANSTFTGPTAISVAPFTPLCPSVPCVNQPNTTTQLQSLGDRLMSRLAYRNFGDHESLVVNQSVAVGTGSGVRWYEIQDPNGTPTVAQQSTFAPDTATFRWLGSIAMDQVGDIALGYNISSDSIFPSIGFASRAAGDPASTLGPETTIVSGAGSQTQDLFGDVLNVWGAYSAMQVDPSDDCTFWYTAEYLANTGIFNWNTRIANFKYPDCDRPDLAISSTHTGNFTQGQNAATYTLTAKNAGGQDSTGTITVIDTLPSGLSATAISGTGWSCGLSTLTCTRTDVLTAGAAYPAIVLTVNVATDAAGIVNNVATVSGGGELNTANDTSTDATTVIQLGPDPTIAISHSGTFIQGQSGTYNISVSNVGLNALDGSVVTVSDTLPSGLTANVVSGAGWTCVVGPPVKCTRSDPLASNANYPLITLTVNIASNAPSALTNHVSVAGGGETNTLNDAASDVVSIIPPPADMTISMSHTGSFQQGGSATYAITVSNTGLGATSGIVTVTETAPVGLTSVFMFGNGWLCTASTCTRRDVLAPAGVYPPITVNASVAGNAPASLTNTAVVSGGGEINTANDTATDPTSITAEPDLAITKTHVGDFTVGQNGVYTITVSNAGSAPTIASINTQVNMNDFLPQGMTATAITATGWNCGTLPTQFVSCSRNDVLAAGAGYPAITMTVNVSGAFASSETNSATVSGGGELNFGNDSASDPTNVKAPVLAITKTHSPATLTVGQTGTYTITVSNTGTVSTINLTSNPVTVTDFLPQGMSLADLSGSVGWTCTSSTPFFSCTRSDVLAPGSSYPPVIAKVQINGAPSNTPVINSASVTGGGDLNNHSASDSATITGPALTIAKTHSPATLVVGQAATYTITVGNTGTTSTITTGNPVTVTDFLPQGMTATDLSASTGWTCSTPPTTLVNCTRSDALASGGTYPAIVITVRIDGAFSSPVTNSASVSGGGDLTQHNASDTAPISAPVLNITKTHVGNFTVGQTGDYTITVSNTGTIATQGTVTVTDSLPFGMTATAIAATGWNCPTLPATGPLSCSRTDSLAPAGSYPVITLTVLTDSTAFPNPINFVTVAGGGDLAFHSAQDNTIINEPDLQVAETHNGTFFAGETNAVYTININNVGTIATAGGTINVSESLSTGLTATAASGTGWTCGLSFPTTFVNCTRAAGTLAPGSAYPSLQVTVNIASDAPAAVVNSVNLNGIGDANTSNNFISDSTPIARVAVVSNSSPAVTVTAGSPATFAFTANLATSPSVGTITFTATGLPPNSTAVFSPATVTQTGAVALTINTSGNGHVALLAPIDFRRQVPPGFALLISMAGLVVAALGLRKRKKTLMRWAFSLSCFCLLLAFSGCGGGGGGSTPPPNPTPTPVPTPTPPPTTQAGTYTITVTATSSNPTVAPATTQVVLTVQ